MQTITFATRAAMHAQEAVNKLDDAIECIRAHFDDMQHSCYCPSDCTDLAYAIERAVELARQKRIEIKALQAFSKSQEVA